MEPLPAPELLSLLQQQNNNLFNALNALTGNISESFRTINLLQQENTRLNEATRAREAGNNDEANNRIVNSPYEDPRPGGQEDLQPRTRLIDRIGERVQVEDRTPIITFPTISGTPVIREDRSPTLLIDRAPKESSSTIIASNPPPPHQPPSGRNHDQGPAFRGEGARRGQVSFAWSAIQWRACDRDQEMALKRVRRNNEGELNIGDLYTYSFIMRTLYGQDERKHTPRSVRKRERRSWSLIEASFIRAVVEVILDPGVGIALEAIRTTSGFRAENPGAYLTDMIIEDQEFPLELATELLVQNGATERWFGHRWTTGYATSYLSEWGKRNYPKQEGSRIAKTYRRILSPIGYERRNPFFLDQTTVVVEDEEIAHLSPSEAWGRSTGWEGTNYEAEGMSNDSPATAHPSDAGIEVNANTDDWLIW